MDIWTPIADIVVLLAVALLLGIVFERLKQNALIGYLFCGVLLGPAGVGWVQGAEEIHGLAELGVALLLFTIGLEFSLKRLRELGTVATVGGALQVVLTGASAALISVWLGLPVAESVAVGAAISVSSTAVVMRVLLDRTELDSLHGRNALGILLLQDLAVVPLVLLITVMGAGAGDWTSLWRMGLKVGAGVVLIAGIYIVGKRLYPYLLRFASAQSNRDLPVILGVAVCLSTTYASHAVGLSPILGAFVGGMLVAESPFAEQVRADIGPLRAVFVTLFFASAGMLAVIPAGESLLKLAGLTAAILVLKVLIVGGVTRLFRQPMRVALATGLTLSQIGEFSFVLLAVGFREAVVSEETFRLLQSASVATLLLTPYLIAAASHVGRVTAAISERARRNGKTSTLQTEAGGRGGDRIIVVGYGPAGQHVVKQLLKARLPFLVIDLNPGAVESHRSAIPIEFGDATQSEILHHVGLRLARALIITVPDPQAAQLIIRQAKLTAPKVVVFARARYHIYAARLAEAGADHVVDEEDLVGDKLGAEFFQAVSHETAPSSGTDEADS